MIQCEVTKDIPADDELVAMLTVSESAPCISSSPSVVTDADICPAAPIDDAAQLPSPVTIPRSPVSLSDDVCGGVIDAGKAREPSSRPVMTENTDCMPRPTSSSSHHNVINSSRKKDKTTSHPNMASTAALSSDLQQQRRSFCK